MARNALQNSPLMNDSPNERGNVVFSNDMSRYIMAAGLAHHAESDAKSNEQLVAMYQAHVKTAYQSGALQDRTIPSKLEIEPVLQMEGARYIYPIQVPGSGILATRMPEGTLELIPQDDPTQIKQIELPFQPGFKQIHSSDLYIMTLDTKAIHLLDEEYNIIKTIPVPDSEGKPGLITFQVKADQIRLYYGPTSTIATIDMDGNLIRAERLPHFNWILSPAQVGETTYLLSTPHDGEGAGELLWHDQEVFSTCAGLNTPIHMSGSDNQIAICDKRGMYILTVKDGRLIERPSFVPVTEIENSLDDGHKIYVRHTCFLGDNLFLFADKTQVGIGTQDTHTVIMVQNFTAE